MANEIFLSKHSKIVLTVGDVVKEVNRFTKDYVLYQLSHIEGDYCHMLILDTNKWSRKGNTVSGDVRCLYGGHNTTYLCYYIPAGKILYGPKAITETT